MLDFEQLIQTHSNQWYRHPFSYSWYGLGVLLIGFFLFKAPLPFWFHLICFICLLGLLIKTPTFDNYFFPNGIKKALDEDNRVFKKRLQATTNDKQYQFEKNYAIKQIKLRKLQVYTYLSFWAILLCEAFFIYACIGHGILLDTPIWLEKHTAPKSVSLRRHK